MDRRRLEVRHSGSAPGAYGGQLVEDHAIADVGKRADPGHERLCGPGSHDCDQKHLLNADCLREDQALFYPTPGRAREGTRQSSR
jgi:hypothetical protein